MAEERRCYNCAIDLICQECNEDDSNWQPIAQKKPMENKVIFESEEQFVNFWKDFTGCDCLPGTREKIKQKGYIRKSAVEEADYIRDNNTRDEIYSDTRLIDIIIDGYDDLKSEIARLKK